jgi:hypothetical protein
MLAWLKSAEVLVICDQPIGIFLVCDFAHG